MNPPMPRVLAVALAALLSVLLAGGCASKSATVTNKREALIPTGPEARLAKESFALHTGLAVGAFHRYVWTPYEAGAFGSRPRVRLGVVIKAASAALFAVHELRAAHSDALASGTLRPLAHRIEALRRKLANLGSLFKHGALSPTEVIATAGAVAELRSAAHRLGGRIRKVAPVF
jgi:hypothetical protein